MRSPIRVGASVVAHVGGASVSGRVAGANRSEVWIADATITSGKSTTSVDGVYVLPRSTPMQVIADGPRPAGGTT